MAKPIRIVQYGLGPIGRSVAETVLEKERTGRLRLVGAIDIDPQKAGRTLSSLLDADLPTPLVVSDEPADVFSTAQPDVVLHTTESYLDQIEDQLLGCLEASLHVISSAEQLAYPYDRFPDVAARLDECAKNNDVVVLGTGVNPGFAMDTLPLVTTGVCTDVSSLFVERIVNAGERREPLQRKIGAGLSLQAFATRSETHAFGHVGLRESAQLIADGLSWSLGRIEESLEPVVADRDVTTPFFIVHEGEVAGIRHTVAGYVDGAEVLTLDLKMFVGAPSSQDTIRITGTPPIDLVVRNGIFGDAATVAALVNAIPRVVAAPPGLKTVNDLPPPRAFATSNALDPTVIQ